MTNAAIIFSESVRLVEEGKLGTTGRMLKVQDAEGNIKTVPEPLPIHTFDEWKRMGLVVRKGEHALAAFPIWMFSESKRGKKTVKTDPENDGENAPDYGRYYMKNAFFFGPEQVEVPKTEPLPA